MAVVETAAGVPAQPAVAQYEPDIAARTALITSVLWVVVATGIGVLAQARLLWPGVLALPPLQYPRLVAIHDNFLAFGWLGTAGFAAIFAIVPRLAAVRLYNEVLGSATTVFWSLMLFAGSGALLLGYNQGQPLAEMPIVIDLVLVLLLLLVAYNATVTVVRRREKTLYTSAWYLLAAALWAPILFVVGNVTTQGGVAGSIVSGFYRSGVELLWLLPIGIGAAYFVVPESTSGVMYSRRLAMIGFWSLAVVGGLAGQRFDIWGPGPDYLESIAIAACVVLAIPVLSATVNLLGSGRGRWGLAARDFGLRFTAAGLGLLLVWTALVALSSQRPAARLVGLTTFGAGVRHLGMYGVFSALGFGFVYHMWPRLVGRAWYSRSAAELHFWTTLLGAVVSTLALIAGGLVQAGGWAFWVAAGDGAKIEQAIAQSAVVLRGFDAIALVSAVAVAVAQLVFAWNVVKTSRQGEPLLAIVSAA